MVVPQVSAVGVAHNTGDPVPETVSGVDATAVGGAMARTDPAAGTSSSQPHMGAMTTSLDDNDMLEVVMGDPVSEH
jgi:hypothetical protein